MILRGTTPRGLSRPGLLLVLLLGAALLPLLPGRARPEAPPAALDAKPAPPAGDVVQFAYQHKSCIACHAGPHVDKKPEGNWKKAHDDVVRLLAQAKADRDRARAVEKRLQEALARLEQLQRQDALRKAAPKERPSAAEKRLEEMERTLNALLKEVESLRKELRPKQQPPAGGRHGRIFYINKREFTIPYKVLSGESSAAELVLVVSDDLGKSHRVVARRKPLDAGFTFTAPRDGEYWFYAFRLGDGRSVAPPVAPPNEPPLKVCVDTVRPKIEAKLSRQPLGKLRLEWEVQDENLDLSTLKIECRRGGEEAWDTLRGGGAGTKGMVLWSVGTEGPFEARLTVTDKAHNRARKELSIAAPAAPRN